MHRAWRWQFGGGRVPRRLPASSTGRSFSVSSWCCCAVFNGYSIMMAPQMRHGVSRRRQPGAWAGRGRSSGCMGSAWLKKWCREFWEAKPTCTWIAIRPPRQTLRENSLGMGLARASRRALLVDGWSPISDTLCLSRTATGLCRLLRAPVSVRLAPAAALIRMWEMLFLSRSAPIVSRDTVARCREPRDRRGGRSGPAAAWWGLVPLGTTGAESVRSDVNNASAGRRVTGVRGRRRSADGDRRGLRAAQVTGSIVERR